MRRLLLLDTRKTQKEITLTLDLEKIGVTTEAAFASLPLLLHGEVPTVVKMFAPSENPTPNIRLRGHFSLAHFTVCRTSHVARALYNMLFVILLPAQPREFTTSASHSPPLRPPAFAPAGVSATSGASTCRRYVSYDPPLRPCRQMSSGLSSSAPRASKAASEK